MSKREGFTLIEVLITVSIVTLMTGAGLVALVPFRERREVLTVARGLTVYLRQIQAKSQAVEVPADCDLSGVGSYRVVLGSGVVDMEVSNPSGGVCYTQLDTFEMSDGVDFVEAGSVVFKAPDGSGEETTIRICGYGTEYNINVGANGSVSEPQKAAVPGC